MDQEKPLQLRDEELLETQRKLKASRTFNAFVIGFMLAVAVWGVANNTLSFWTIALMFVGYLIYRNRKQSNS